MDKDLVVIVSGGRTGTRFFGDLMGGMIEDAFSVHEPDVLYAWKLQSLKHIADFGLWNMVVGRLLGRTGIRVLSQRMLSDNIGLDEAKDWVRAGRDRYYESIASSLIIEANGQWYGALPALRAAYPNCKIVGIIRDPRNWVRSWINHGGQRDRTDRYTLGGARRISPAMIGDAVYSRQWAEMNTFEKLCWDWTVTYQAIDEYVEEAENATMFRFEDLFLAEERSPHIARLFDFICEWPERTYSSRMDDALWSKTINASRPDRLAKWRDWSGAEAGRLSRICCGDLTQRYGYCCESEWRAKLDSDPANR